jgi:hypothetical protein
MNNPDIECILSRSAAKYYDTAATMSDEEIHELVRTGMGSRRSSMRPAYWAWEHPGN